MNRILVTGCAGDIGIAIGRILKERFPNTKLVGSDITQERKGTEFFDINTVLPRADAADYLEKLQMLVSQEKTDCIIPVSEAEIRFFHASKMHDVGGVPLLLANDATLHIGLDKLKTSQFLEANHLPHPWTLVVKEGPPQEIPCIIKSRFGRGSRGVQVVQKEDVEALTKARPDDIWQELLLPETQEYTCGVYGCSNGEIRLIVMRRVLGGGLTVSGEVVDNEAIRSLVEKLAQLLELSGPMNVQLRLTHKGPMIFEINPRFSSTVRFRHLMGFTDVLWSLQEKTGTVASPYTPAKAGTKFERVGGDEHIL